MDTIDNKEYADATIEVDDIVFRKCKFSRCLLIYSGGENCCPLGVPMRLLQSVVPVFTCFGCLNLFAVEPGKPSKTSVYAAMHRALGTKNPDYYLRNPDVMAKEFVGPEERAILKGFPSLELLDIDDFNVVCDRLRKIGDFGSMVGILVRTKHIDALMAQAIKEQSRQIVILGAGFDSRAYRLKNSLNGVRVFEVDFPPTQAYKKKRVTEIIGKLPDSKDVIYVGIDFSKQSLSAALNDAGYNAREKTFFIWEAVTYYIPEDAVDSTLRFVASQAAKGSSVVFDYKFESLIKTRAPVLFASWGEPWIFGFPDDGLESYLRSRGLNIGSNLDGEALAKLYLTKPDGMRPLGSTTNTICHAIVP